MSDRKGNGQEMPLGVYFPSGTMGFPSSSRHFEMLKVARARAIVKNRNRNAKCLPGQILLPHPKTACSGSITSGFISPSFKNRLGLKLCASGYTDSFRNIAHVLSMTVAPAGMNIPLYRPSFIERCREPIGIGGLHLRTSFMMAET